MSEELHELSQQLWRVKHLLTTMSVKELSPLNLGFLLGEANLLMQQQLTKLSELIVKTQNTETLIK
jgi:hypothetical protein